MKTKAFVSCFVAAFAVGAFAADAYIEADGTQAIVTDYYPNPATKIVADYAFTATAPAQMAVLPLKLTVGRAFTVTIAETLAIQP